MKTAERQFTTLSGVPIEPVYGPDDVKGLELAAPGEFPYTRGIHRDMYRGKLWTMRQFSGFATPEETNRRYHYLLEQGQTGLSVAFDLPTLMGYDADHAMSEGEVGKCGASISSLEDMEILFRGIPLGDVTVSMTINSPAAVLWAMYLAVAEQQGADWSRLSGTLQNDILKEYIAQKEYIFPPRPSMRLVTDTIEFGARHTPKFNPISISGYHIREAGSTAVQELAFTLRDGMEYVDWAIERGLAIDEFAPRLSFFFNAHNDFFEEIAKYRAARKIWALAMRDRYGARNERSLKMRFHAQTAGCSLTWQQPYNNVVRTALQAMAAVLGGAQSLHTNSLDEAYALPGEHAVTLALRTQQVLAYESGVTAVADPLGGSYFLEKLTLDTEAAANRYIRQIDEMGGMIPAIEAGFPQTEIAAASYRYQREIEPLAAGQPAAVGNRKLERPVPRESAAVEVSGEPLAAGQPAAEVKRKLGRPVPRESPAPQVSREEGERVIVGVNRFQSDDQPIELLQIDETSGQHQRAKLAALRQRRDNAKVQQTLDALKRAAEGTENTMPYLLDAVRAYATLGEICEALRSVFGTYTETTHL